MSEDSGTGRVRRHEQRFTVAGEALARFELCRVLLRHQAVISSEQLPGLRGMGQWDRAVTVYAGLVALAEAREDAQMARSGWPGPCPVLPVTQWEASPDGARWPLLVQHETCTRNTLLQVTPRPGDGGAILVIERRAPLRPGKERDEERDAALAALTGYCGKVGRVLGDDPDGLPGLRMGACRRLEQLRDWMNYRTAYLCEADVRAILDDYVGDADEWADEDQWAAQLVAQEEAEEAERARQARERDLP